MLFSINLILKRSQLRQTSVRYFTSNIDEEELFKGLDGNHPCATKRQAFQF